jgi:hypothetical protein
MMGASHKAKAEQKVIFINTKEEEEGAASPSP